MPLAVELYLDPPADKRVRAIWRTLDAAGVPSLGSVPGTDYHPHVSLAAFDSAKIDDVVRVVRPLLAECLGIALPLVALGAFLTQESVAFLSVVPTEPLLAAHRGVADALRPVVQGYWPYYEPSALLPHCTLAMGVIDHARVVEAVRRHELPILAEAFSAQLVDVSTGKSVAGVTRR
jgi:hypothetical protein